MQTPTTLPIQVAPAANASNAARSASAAQNADAAQFAQALSREIDQRQNSPAPQAAPQPAQATQQSAPAPRAQDAQAPEQAKPAEAPAPAKPADAGAADSKSASADNDGEGADAAKDDAAAAASTPLADMLALVASFNQPVAVDAKRTSAPVAASDAGAVAGEALQAAALGGDTAQQAMPTVAGAGKAALPAGDAASFKVAAQSIGLNGAAAAKAVAEVDPQAASGLAGAATAKAGPSSPALPALAHPAPADNKLAALAMPAQAADGAPGSPTAGAVAGSGPAALPQADAVLRTPEPAALKDVPVGAPLIAPMGVAMTPAAAAIAQAAAAAPANQLGARVGTPAWDNQVGQKIIWMVAGKEQSASLTLNPPDLGPMQVVLNVTNDQATVTFTAAQPEVRQALENAMPKLRDMMSENGIALGNATVNAGMPDQRQAQQNQQDPQSRGQAAFTRFGGNDSNGAQGTSLAPVRQVRTDGVVDTFA